MVSSFRSTVLQWLAATLQADVYVGASQRRLADSAAVFPLAVRDIVVEQVARHRGKVIDKYESSLFLYDQDRRLVCSMCPLACPTIYRCMIS